MADAGPMAAVLAARPLLRAGLCSLLRAMGFYPVEGAENAEELRRQLDDKRISPELLLIDLSDTSVSVSDVKDWAPTTKVVLLAADLDLRLSSEYFASGACGYLLKNISADAFDKSIRLVLAGEKVLPSELATVIPGIGLSHHPTAKDGRFERLSNRELEILRCLAKGRSNRAIADTLGIAEATVKVHVKRILQKIRASNRTQAAVWCATRGLTKDNPRTEGSLLQSA